MVSFPLASGWRRLGVPLCPHERWRRTPTRSFLESQYGVVPLKVRLGFLDPLWVLAGTQAASSRVAPSKEAAPLAIAEAANSADLLRCPDGSEACESPAR